MANQSVTDKVISIVADAQQLSADDVPLDSSFDDLGINSLQGLNIIYQLEAEFDIEIPNERAAGVHTVRQLAENLEELLTRLRAVRKRQGVGSDETANIDDEVSPMMGQLLYRPFREGDLPAVLQLWEQDTTWGAISEETWRKWFIDTPHGPALVTVAENHQGEIVAQKVGLPSRLIIGGREVKSLRLSAPILRRDLRLATLRREDHPAVGLLQAHLQTAKSLGFSVIYSQPQRGFLAFFAYFSRLGLPTFQTATYPCTEFSLEHSCAAFDERIQQTIVCVAETFTPKYDALWLAAQQNHVIGCGTVRDARYLPYKLGAHLVLEVRVRDADSLLGYVAVKKNSGLIVDVLSRAPDDLAIVLGAALAYLTDKRDIAQQAGIPNLKAMGVPFLRPALEALNFKPVEFTFAFACLSLDSSVSAEQISPDRWYLTPGD